METPDNAAPLEPGEAAPVRRRSWLLELADTFLPAVAIVLVVNLLLAQPRTVHGQSMEPCLHENERVIIDLISLHWREPRRGEIVVLRLPNRRSDPLIKRVIGLPGDAVEIRGGKVLVNGEVLDEPYLDQATSGHMPPEVVPEAHVFVLGDNRSASNDSRYFGMVPYENILGRAWLRYWPPSEIELFH